MTDHWPIGYRELRSTQTLSPISVENLKVAHAIAESGKSIGKVTLSGF
jgi:hypothetical protein